MTFVTRIPAPIKVFVNGDLNDKDTLEQHIREVQVGTCTNLMAGLARGFEVNLKFVFHFRGILLTR